jgi:sirohydrochlorin cobaltochelatase
VQALVLVGHGSQLSAHSSEPLYQHGEAIRALGLFDEVQECFWKEEPALRDALALLESDLVFVVPVFIAEGYFTGVVIPREMGLCGPAPSETRVGGKRVLYTPPVGTHASMASMILRRAEEVAGLEVSDAAEAALVIIGHGTERHATSGEAIWAAARSVRDAAVFRTVHVGFLDQSPAVVAVVDGLVERRVVLVPFFIAEGWHTQETIPDDLGLHRPSISPVTERDGRTIYYASPVGTLPEVADVILQRAAEAGAHVTRGARSPLTEKLR